MSDLFRRISQICRAHARRPGFALVVIAILALGIGASAAIFSVVYALLLGPLPFPDGDELVVMMSSQPERKAFYLAASYVDLLDVERASETLDEVAAISTVRSVVMSGLDRAEHLAVELVSGDLFTMLGVEAVHGRVFGPDDDLHPGAHPVVLLSHDFWRNRFAADPEVVGRQVMLNEKPYTVIGVLSPAYRGAFWEPIDAWLPIQMAADVVPASYLTDRGRHWVSGMARLAPGVTIDQARQELERMAAELEKQYPSNQGYRFAVRSLKQQYYEYAEHALWAGMRGGGFLLGLCAINVAALMLTRRAVRQHELALRSALGASAPRLALEQLVESLLLSLAGGGLGLALAAATTHKLIAYSTIPAMSFDGDYMSLEVVWFVLLVAVGSALVFGMVPAAEAFRRREALVLRESAPKARRLRARSLLSGLVVLELALATLILFGAGLAFQRFLELSRDNLGFASDEILTLKMDLTGSRFDPPGAFALFGEALREKVGALPGVAGVALVGPSAPPEANMYTDVTIEDWLAKGLDSPSDRFYRQHISPGFFAAMGIPLLEGRDFTSADGPDAPPVAVVNEAIAKTIWPGQSAIGKRFRRGLPHTNSPWLTVVGVVGTSKSRGPKDFGKGDMDVYLAYAQDPTTPASLMVRAGKEPEALTSSVRDAVQEIAPDLPVYQLTTMRARVASLARDERFLGLLLGVFAVFALLITIVGVYGVLAYRVRQRTREIGVRMALGADQGTILRGVLLQGAGLLAIGLALGVATIYGFADRLFGLGQGLGRTEIQLLVLACAVLCLVAFVAIVLPARRASRLSPTVALADD